VGDIGASSSEEFCVGVTFILIDAFRAALVVINQFGVI
jgi:hypothetical protein